MNTSHIDLHCHTLASDGQLTPSAVVERAHENGVKILAITDHDTLDGLAEARESAGQRDIELISGVEFSSAWQGMGVHLVGLNLEETSVSLQKALSKQMMLRMERAQAIGSKLAKAGLPGLFEKAQELAGNSVLGRPHFASAMVDMGIVQNHKKAFKKYLGAGKLGDVNCQWPKIQEIVATIVGAGGNAVLAHPGNYKMSYRKLRRLIDEFKEAGGHAIEVVSGLQHEDLTASLARAANESQLLASIGSDFHGPPQNWHDLGRCSPLPSQCMPLWETWAV